MYNVTANKVGPLVLMNASLMQPHQVSSDLIADWTLPRLARTLASLGVLFPFAKKLDQPSTSAS